MTVYVVRHAKAGSRRQWSGPDDLRPLSKNGRRQAEAIADALADVGITRVVTSPYVRCVQTVEPLAARVNVPVDVSESLVEGAPLGEALALLEKFADEDVVLCSHGDVIGELLVHVAGRGVPLGDLRLEKGSTWALECRAGQVVSARYVAPSA